MAHENGTLGKDDKMVEAIVNETEHLRNPNANDDSRLFVDMDGTLAVFNEVDTLEKLYEKGYFENLQPHQNIVDAIKLIRHDYPQKEIFILSSVLTDSEFALDEKNAWLDKHLPEIDRTHRIFTPCGESKNDYIRNLKDTDFLLDDYTKNLTLWEPPGKGIKFVNAINDTHGTWRGQRVNYDVKAQELAQTIIQAISPDELIVPSLALNKQFEHEPKDITTGGTAQPLAKGNLIYSMVNLPRYATQASGKIFVVNEVKQNGGFLAYKLTANALRFDLPQAISIKRDKLNSLAKDSIVMTDEIFEFPAGWKYTAMHGKLTDEQMQTINSKRRTAECEIITFSSSPILTDGEKARQIIEGAYSNFKQDPKKLVDYLEFSANFKRFSPRNTVLIFNQNSGASFVASKSDFEKMGYKILPQQNDKAIKILRPQTYEYFERNSGEKAYMNQATTAEREGIRRGDIKVYTQSNKFVYYNVYDISQTDCPTSEYPKLLDVGIPSECHKEYFERMVKLMERTGIDVNIKDMSSITLSGCYNRAENSITINKNLADTQRLSTMCHESAHALLHKTSTQPIEIVEFEAQSAAILMQSRLGLEIEDNDISYLCRYMKKAKTLPRFNINSSLSRVAKQVDFMTANTGGDESVNYFSLQQGHSLKPSAHAADAPILIEKTFL